MHAYFEYERTARGELRDMDGDTTTLREASIERYSNGFLVHWECQHISERWRINPYLPQDYVDAIRAFPAGLTVIDK